MDNDVTASEHGSSPIGLGADVDELVKRLNDHAKYLYRRGIESGPIHEAASTLKRLTEALRQIEACAIGESELYEEWEAAVLDLRAVARASLQREARGETPVE